MTEDERKEGVKEESQERVHHLVRSHLGPMWVPFRFHLGPIIGDPFGDAFIYLFGAHVGPFFIYLFGALGPIRGDALGPIGGPFGPGAHLGPFEPIGPFGPIGPFEPLGGAL